MFKILILTLSISVLCRSDQLDNVLNCVCGIKGADINTDVVTGSDGNRYLLIPASTKGTKGVTDLRTPTSGMPPSLSRNLLFPGSDTSLPDSTSLPLSKRLPLSPSRVAISPQIRGALPASRSPSTPLTRRIPASDAMPSRQLPIPGWGLPSGPSPPLASVAKGVTLRPAVDSASTPVLLPRVDSSWWDKLRDGLVTTVRPQIAAPFVSNNTLYNMWQSFLDSSPPTKTDSGRIAPISNDKLLNKWSDFHWNKLKPELLADMPSLTRDGLNRLWNQFLQKQPQTQVIASTPEETFENLNKLWQTFENDVLTTQQQMQLTEAPPTKTKPMVNELLYRIWSEFAKQRKALNNDSATNDDLNRWWLELLWSQQKPQLTAAYPGLSADKLYKLWLSYLRKEPEINLSVDPPDIAYERQYGRWARFLGFLQTNANQLDITQPIVQQQRDDDLF